MPPIIPLPFKPREKISNVNKRTAAQQAVINQAKIEKAHKEDEAVEKLRTHIKEEIARLGEQFSKKEQYFYSLLHLKVKSETQRRKQVNSYNAFLRDYAEKENQGTLPGRLYGDGTSRLSIAFGKIVRQVRNYPYGR
ncbi:MAG TPA: hypothetical protein VGO47_03725 [Chlamydiales bacterium]|jgi:hypothetical protein|nr:hypothetical protein [Chlamydiales bacterium]